MLDKKPESARVHMERTQLIGRAPRSREDGKNCNDIVVFNAI